MLALLVSCSGGGDTTAIRPEDTPVLPAPVIALSSESVAATLSAGNDSTSTVVTITAGNSAALGSIVVENVSSTSTSAWLSTTLSASSAPATLTLRVSSLTLAAGTFTATLRISAAGATPRLLAITAVVSAQNPALVLERTELTLAAEPGGFVPRSPLKITSLFGTISGLKLSPISCGSGPSQWLAVDLDRTQTPATVGVSVDAMGFAPGKYSCSFTVSTSQPSVENAAQTISVTADVHFVPRITFSPLLVNINGITGRSPAPFAIIVANGSAGGVLDALSLGPITYVGDGSGWLSASLSKTDAPAVLVLAASAAQLGVGTYKALVSVLSGAKDVGNSPAVLEVNFFVSPISNPGSTP